MKNMTIEGGAEHWQVFQHINQAAFISLTGAYRTDIPGKPCIRIVNEQTNETVVDYTPVKAEKGRWEITLKVPCGGLYRIETWIRHEKEKRMPAECRGDYIHHIGVGDLYFIAGQSNAAGTGRGYAPDQPELGVHVLRDRNRWDIATTPLDCERDYHSPFLSFGKKMKEKLGYPIGLIPFAVGGSFLSQWLPEEDGVYYKEMISIAKHRGLSPKAIFWYQGCSEAAEGRCHDYLQRFEAFVTHCRHDLEQPDLPIFTCQLNQHRDVCAQPDRDDNWAKIREQQRIAPEKIKHCYVTSTFDLALSDGIHNNAVSNISLGERLAYLALKKLYGTGTMTVDAPNIKSAKMTSDCTLELTFDHITNTIFIFHAGLEAPLKIEDEKGNLPFTDIYEQKNKLILTLQRKPQGNATVSAMAKATVSRYMIDLGTQLPVLGFYQFKIEQA